MSHAWHALRCEGFSSVHAWQAQGWSVELSSISIATITVSSFFPVGDGRVPSEADDDPSAVPANPSSRTPDICPHARSIPTASSSFVRITCE